MYVFCTPAAAGDGEEIGRHRWISYLQVTVLILPVDISRSQLPLPAAQHEKPLQSRRRVLRSLAVQAVRQREHQSEPIAPFLLGAGESVVDDDLRRVGKVAKLGFPDDQGVGIGCADAVFEAHGGVFAQG